MPLEWARGSKAQLWQGGKLKILQSVALFVPKKRCVLDGSGERRTRSVSSDLTSLQSLKKRGLHPLWIWTMLWMLALGLTATAQTPPPMVNSELRHAGGVGKLRLQATHALAKIGVCFHIMSEMQGFKGS